MRLAVYLELPYRRDADGYSTDRAFVRFLLALRPHLDQLVLVGRVDPEPGRAAYAIPDDVEVRTLPHYPSLRDLAGIARVAPATLRALWAALDGVDAVWSIGPHPMSVPTALFGLTRGRRVVLGVRQDFPQYVRHRLPSPRWRPVLAAAYALESVFRLLARRLPAVAVGGDLARRYAGGRAPVLELAVSLVSEDELRSGEGRSTALSAGDAVELLSVGRLDPEKAPDVLLAAFGRALSRSERPLRLTVVGTGPLEERLRGEAEPLGHAVRFLGYVPQGPQLWRLYREADAFVHAARTEGFPQVLVEAFAAGLPAVATDVGGVRAGALDGRAALLVPPDDPDALADAVLGLLADDGLRARLAAEGHASVRELTLERQAERVAAFIADRAAEARNPAPQAR